jgi:hypothetical protein
MSQPGSTVESSTKALDEGSYEVVRRRLLEQVAALVERTEKLNGARKALFGASSFELVQSSRVRTENNGVARDMLSFAGSLLFAFEVALGLKSQPSVADVLSLYRFDPESAEGLEPLSHEGTFLADQAFVSEFGTAFRYAKEARILQLKRTDKRLLIVVQIGAVLSDVKVFRFSIDAKGNVKYIDARGEEDYVPPPSFGFAWKRTGREEQVSGPHPHVNVLDEVFVETIGGDLTIKVENNTKDGRGIYREPVADANQTLDDAEISYAKVGALILLKVKPFREEETRYYVYNTIKRDVVRVDAIGQSCLELPEDQGIIFPGGHYVTASQARVVDTDTAGMRFESMVRAPNGEDVLYVFYRADEGVYLLLPYNLITKETGSPVRCNGYSLFEDGTMAVFRAQAGTEPTRVHPFQVWKTPFCTQEHAELRGKITTASYLAKVGNASWCAASATHLPFVSSPPTRTPRAEPSSSWCRPWAARSTTTSGLVMRNAWISPASCAKYARAPTPSCPSSRRSRPTRPRPPARSRRSRPSRQTCCARRARKTLRRPKRTWLRCLPCVRNEANSSSSGS